MRRRTYSTLLPLYPAKPAPPSRRVPLLFPLAFIPSFILLSQVILLQLSPSTHLRVPYFFLYPPLPSPPSPEPDPSRLRASLHDTFRIPHLFLESMPHPMLVRLRARLHDASAAASASSTPRATPPTAKLFLVHAQNGLGNRVRAVASALGFVDAHPHRVAVILWERDLHINASFPDLFRDRHDLILLHHISEPYPFPRARATDPWAWSGVDTYNYMSNEPTAVRRERMVDDPRRHIYFRSSEAMEAADADVRMVQARMQRAVKALVPVEEVERAVGRFGDLSRRIGVHIRNVGVREEFADREDFEPDKVYGAEALERMEYWRAHCSVEVFVEEMRAQVRADPAATFFVAGDTPEAFARMREEFDGRVAHMDTEGGEKCLSVRDRECSRRALVDMIALSRTKLLLGSHWSSFTSTVMSMGVKSWRRAGIEFAAPKAAVGP